MKHSFTVTKYVPNTKTVIWEHEFTAEYGDTLDPKEWTNVFNNPKEAMLDAIVRSTTISLANRLRACKTEAEAVKLFKAGLKADDKVSRVKVVEKVVYKVVRSRSDGELNDDQIRELKEVLELPSDAELHIKYID